MSTGRDTPGASPVCPLRGGGRSPDANGLLDTGPPGIVRVDRGAFTAEFAAALPALTLLLAAGLTAVSASADQGRCYDAARDAALTAARGGSGVEAGQAAAPPGATVTLIPEVDQVRAVVTVPVRALGFSVPELRATGEAVAAIEPGVSVVAE